MAAPHGWELECTQFRRPKRSRAQRGAVEGSCFRRSRCSTLEPIFDGKRQPAVYILASPDRRAIYVGVTTNLEGRLNRHRLGLMEHTARYNICRLVYVEMHDAAPDAIATEKRIKAWRREKKVALIDSINPEWEDLAPEANV